MKNLSRLAIVVVALTMSVAACSGSSGSNESATTQAPAATTAPTSPSRPLRVLVTNDDGVDAPGIDAVVERLRQIEGVEVTVVAPATNQSGTGGQTTSGPLTVADTTTASGYPAKAVTGFPADTVVWALDQGGVPQRPDVVISGVNFGQNLGPTVEISGTVGAARAAATRGIPALAASQGLAATPDYPAAVELVAQWLEQHRAAILDGGASGGSVLIENLNVPTCTTGAVGPLLTEPVATDLAGRDVNAVDCTASTTDATDDVDAFLHGHAVISPLTAAAA